MSGDEGNIVSETTREDISLKTGTKKRRWCACDEECLSGAKFVNIAFGTITFVISVALLIQIYYGDYQVIPHGSVATDSLECSKIGTKTLKDGGNAVDAAISSAFCLCVVTQHFTGLDAKGQVLIYNHKTRELPTVVDFSSPNVISDKLPPMVLGLAYIHQQFGTMAWRDLVEPSVQIAKNGYLVPKMLVQAVNKVEAQNLYGRLEPGQLLSHKSLGKTLERIANISETELYSYIDPTNQPIQSQAVKLNFYGYDVFVPSAQSIGPLMLVNLKNVDEFNFTVADTQLPQYYMHKIVDTTLKVYQEYNISKMFHVGTMSNVAVMDTDDNYVSLVTGMQNIFGNKELTDLGYVQDSPPKEEYCSRVPIIITDSNVICGRRMVLAANGLDMATQLVSNLVIGKETSTEGIEAPRFSILVNGSVGIEGSRTPMFSEETIQYIEEQVHSKRVFMTEPYFSSNIVEKIKDDLISHSDSRGGGIASRF